MHMTRMGKRSLYDLPPWMVRNDLSQEFESHVQQADSEEPDDMFSSYQNYGTYGPNSAGFKRRNRQLAYDFGLGK